ncbi:MAG: hypothetical protein R3A48_18785 [Polyangiales bacterium]
MSTSHPLEASPSQSPRPALQAATVQRPATHAPLPLAGAQIAPQAPQWEALVRVFTSQPFAGLPSQFAEPALQAPTPQTPATHAPLALAGAQARPQAPQLARLVRVSVSQPFIATPSQSAKPAAQLATAQRPASQLAVALGSVQVAPQAPQCARAVLTSVSQPLVASPSQSPRPALQVATAQTPARQVALPPETAHAFRHAPQCEGDTRVSVSQPLAASPSQSAKPAAQVSTRHTPPEHAAVATFAVAHDRPQLPQFAVLPASSTSQPLLRSPSHSP